LISFSPRLQDFCIHRRQLIELEKEAIDAGVIESPTAEIEPDPVAAITTEATDMFDHPLATP
jgi:hypothetical protein